MPPNTSGTLDSYLVEHWRQKLQNLSEFQLPLDYPRQLPSKYVDATQTRTLPDNVSLALLQLSLANQVSINEKSQEPVSPFIILLSAFTTLLHRYTGEEDIVVGSSSQSSNPLVLRLPIQNQSNFSQIINTVHDTELEAAKHEIPFSTLFDSLYPKKTRKQVNPPPLFRVRFFNWTDTDEDTLSQTTTVNDLTVFIKSNASESLRSVLPKIEITINYNQTLFSSSRIEHILDQLSMVLLQAQQQPNLEIGNISLVTERCLNVIPDPTANLNWEGWQGAIPKIFTDNANLHPERDCLVETLYNTTDNTYKVRKFNYAQVNRAANILAHHLINSGIQREDVVTMYAYRGVDLAVGVMGILKAGCTFNVIDPAYPPQRQQIYLSVARPKAILVLEKAGTLIQSVRDYIDTELQVTCEIQNLEMLSDGAVVYSSKGETHRFPADMEVLDANVEVGPDSVATLSFTSGSTGVPKGVRGRHFSLTHFYPWMAQQFQLSDQDNFTMLSGIAHDPIQRDIFTPFFLGAQLHIPDPEIIGIPGLLSKWMDDSKVTVTHLTPAMGQLLSANAETNIPSLKNAFFVGDILTKRDCLRLQQLASNCSVINMYGTTETQRAVSYYRVPSIAEHPAFLTSAKDILPAGTGMVDVQLLVVSRLTDKEGKRAMCGVGEAGEIYVRSSGLSEGYLGLPEATAEKFLTNWFNTATIPTTNTLNYFKGPRDRMYKSGDLGRYTPDGTVECIGRADDQVKIRGFRIELGEIDTHLSQHPRIRENVTLVRRDQNEEQTLVSYFIPIDTIDDVTSAEETSVPTGIIAPRRYRSLIRDIRDWLKQKLPSYSVPSVFVPLIRMPLNPNGKVDKPALPFPDTFKQSVPTALPTKVNGSASELLVYQIWSQLLNLDSAPDLDANFFDLGGHSILATRLIFQIRKLACVDLPLGIVFQRPTIRGLAKAIDERKSLDLNIAGLNENESSIQLNDSEGKEATYDYASDLPDLLKLANWSNSTTTFKTRSLDLNRPTFLLTGATGFLGAFILKYLLATNLNAKVYCLARADDDQHALKRIKDNCTSQLVWNQSWEGRVIGISGDLAKPKLGLSPETYNELVREVDSIVHNGALVHWVYPYPKLRDANVLGTLETLNLAYIDPDNVKPVHFVSSTSVLDTDHYVTLSENDGNEDSSQPLSPVLKKLKGVPESDDLEGSRVGLRSGYGQSKWVAEKLVMYAGSIGLPTTILRPGYVVGDSKSGVTVTDDFLWRLVKGCIQIGKIPKMYSQVNMCPVDYVASTTACAAYNYPTTNTTLNESATIVYHITNPHKYRFDKFFQSLVDYGYQVTWCDYIDWKNLLMDTTLKSQDNALYPLLHFVLDDLPTSTKAPTLDDTNTTQLIQNKDVVCNNISTLMGLYLAYLIEVKFLNLPENDAKFKLPKVNLDGVKILERSNRG